ncbi:protein NipSnap-like isoform X2 [Saccostrea echinata]|uniref:protein NipSnap-like isoform X2 n=1 Tax=Saccostrea echinata TaxID=191078 RepID=UPI002A7EBC36|nr:protein NipSnap-like isoform X2 [Saccostrea echinata]
MNTPVMARLLKSIGVCGKYARTKQLCEASFISHRCLSTSAVLQDDDSHKKSFGMKQIQFIKSIFDKSDFGPYEIQKESHSSQLSDKETVYEIQLHAVKPESMEEYLKQFSQFQELMHVKKTGAHLVGSFTVEIGDQDEAIHIWEYKGGYPVLNNATEIYRTDQDFINFRISRNKMLRHRKNQILLPFNFWPAPVPREGRNIYEMRSYTLKPGSMIEWSNCWRRGIEHRRNNNEPVAGFFTHIGEQNVVHHLWGYKDLQTRKETRAMAWSKPGWDECVAYTVPLIRHMESRILIPTPFSPVQ